MAGYLKNRSYTWIVQQTVEQPMIQRFNLKEKAMLWIRNWKRRQHTSFRHGFTTENNSIDGKSEMWVGRNNARIYLYPAENKNKVLKIEQVKTVVMRTAMNKEHAKEEFPKQELARELREDRAHRKRMYGKSNFVR